jgi:hypothetical protein
MTDHGKVRYELKTPYRDGTTHGFFGPIDFIGKLAALISRPRLNLTRFYGVFAPNSNLRAQVTASQRGKNSPRLVNEGNEQSSQHISEDNSVNQRSDSAMHASSPEISQDFQLIIIKAMIGAAKSDGHIDEVDQKRIFDAVQQMSLTS